MYWTCQAIVFLFHICFAVPTFEASNGDTGRMQWQNTYDGDLAVTCGDKQGLFRVVSEHDTNKRDRVWQWDCRNVAKTSFSNCYWTDYVADLDEPFVFQCPANYILSGVHSYHNSGPEDRRWKFRCCNAEKHFTRNCFTTGYVNDWHQRIQFEVDLPHVFTGVYSYHSNDKEDRKYKLLACQFVFCSEI